MSVQSQSINEIIDTCMDESDFILELLNLLSEDRVRNNWKQIVLALKGRIRDSGIATMFGASFGKIYANTNRARMQVMIIYFDKRCRSATIA